ncbi:microfibrillar-associated protein 1-like protein [Corchorus olitorius]|uniref:Microfibrillar-associated protein 1-like protein n=1 Tax=Corchorus olitorius TaxID=93759 RepID=A0A1R3JDM9_9ROSI|nr:microfibrillar-associated protein 1-like protein [Corchorus olitorius]
MLVMAGVSDTQIAISDKLRGKLGQTKVKRYWPGKAPEWADDADEEGDIKIARVVALENAFTIHDDSDILRKVDSRRKEEKDKGEVASETTRGNVLCEVEEEELEYETDSEEENVGIPMVKAVYDP